MGVRSLVNCRAYNIEQSVSSALGQQPELYGKCTIVRTSQHHATTPCSRPTTSSLLKKPAQAALDMGSSHP